MQLRHLEYLTILARERHFGAAARACGISQSALSQALRNVEQEFGAPIVIRRNQGFQAFTAEGERVLEWARSVLADHKTLLQEIAGAGPGSLSAHLRLGVIPIATPMVSLLTSPFRRLFPGVTISLQSHNSGQILRGLERFELEAGITYLDHAENTNLRPYVLYSETYYLLAPKSHAVAAQTSVTWRDVAALPLCLLSPDMLNRVLLDGIFQSAGVTATTVIDTDCAMLLCSHVRSGEWFTIVPHSFFYVIEGWGGTKALPIEDPTASNTMGLLVAERTPMPPVINAFVEVVQTLDISSELRKYVA
jgi:DNA-binding transcriptional LysR family regulator